jgi:hypothetical protein
VSDRTDDPRYSYEGIKQCVSGDGWKGAVITPSSLDAFEGVDYHDAHEIAKRLVADGVLVPDGLHRWRRA